MILGEIDELTIFRTFDRGIPNNERIAIIVNKPVTMGQYGLLVGFRQEARASLPIYDNFFWFGDGLVNNGDWLFVYTGPGTARADEIPGRSGRVYTLHWGREKTIFNHPDIVPILVRFDAVQTFIDPAALPPASGQS